MSEYLISVNPPYAKLITSELKKHEFRKKIIKDMMIGDTVYIYETKNKCGKGLVIGQAIIDKLYKTDYAKGKNKNKLIELKEDLYKTWEDTRKPYSTFEGYLKVIDYTSFDYNYVIRLEYATEYVQGIPLSCFATDKGIIKHPPINMCRVAKIS